MVIVGLQPYMEAVSPICPLLMGCFLIPLVDSNPGHYTVPSALAVSVLCASTQAFPCYYWMGVSSTENFQV